MTEADRVQIKSLWESRVPIEQIVQMLPYRQSEARMIIAELRESGTLKPRNKKQMASAKIAEAFEGGMTSIAELCEVFGYSENTIKTYLLAEGVRRGTPSHYKPSQLNDKAVAIMGEIAKGEKPLSQIATEFAVSRQYVHQLKKRMEKGEND